MDLKDVLLRKEREQQNYQRLSREAGLPPLCRIFEMLARDETRHLEALREVQQGKPADLPPSTTLKSARSTLRRLSMEEGELARYRGDLSLFTAAMDFEAGCARACGKFSTQSAEEGQKKILSRISAEDEMHFTLLEEMRELLEPFVARGGEGGALHVK